MEGEAAAVNGVIIGARSLRVRLQDETQNGPRSGDLKFLCNGEFLMRSVGCRNISCAFT
jgi:hypothetical protein